VTNGTSQAIRQSLDLTIRINQQEGSANLAGLRLVLEPEIAGLAATRLHDPGGYVEADLDFHLGQENDRAMQAEDILYIPNNAGKSILYRGVPGLVDAATSAAIYRAY
jgi:hypothetical protein